MAFLQPGRPFLIPYHHHHHHQEKKKVQSQAQIGYSVNHKGVKVPQFYKAAMMLFAAASEKRLRSRAPPLQRKLSWRAQSLGTTNRESSGAESSAGTL